MDDRQTVEALSALAQTTRLQIVRHLVRAGAAGMAAGALGAEVGASSSRLSFHLSTLEQAQIVSAERVGRQMIYRAKLDRLGALIGYLVEDCFDRDPVILARVKPDDPVA